MITAAGFNARHRAICIARVQSLRGRRRSGIGELCLFTPSLDLAWWCPFLRAISWGEQLLLTTQQVIDTSELERLAPYFQRRCSAWPQGSRGF